MDRPQERVSLLTRSEDGRRGGPGPAACTNLSLPSQVQQRSIGVVGAGQQDFGDRIGSVLVRSRLLHSAAALFGCC